MLACFLDEQTAVFLCGWARCMASRLPARKNTLTCKDEPWRPVEAFGFGVLCFLALACLDHGMHHPDQSLEVRSQHFPTRKACGPPRQRGMVHAVLCAARARVSEYMNRPRSCAGVRCGAHVGLRAVQACGQAREVDASCAAC